MNKISDNDPLETEGWREALASVLEFEGPDRAHFFLLDELFTEARRKGTPVPYSGTTPYLNTIAPDREARHPGDRAIEHKIRSLIRWNALAIVLRANKESSELGGHIASFQSAATLYDTGFQHFWNAPSDKHGGDLVFIQGHCLAGIYARAFLEGRLTEEQLLNFREEVDGAGLSSYPHPWLMPDFWQFPTVSMGLGPLMAIYQARFLKYLHDRGLADTANRKVWAFMGDGEMDQPESLGAISLGGREKLDNLVFVINCNLQRLDGPVRGNGKIVQELEGDFRGAGWNIIKVLWGGSRGSPLIASDTDGRLLRRIKGSGSNSECPDFKSKNGAYVREHFFGKDPELKARVAGMSDEQIWSLTRGGHDPSKVYAAYAAAVAHKGQPTVILAKTVKGYGMGEAGEGQNITHQPKKMGEAVLGGSATTSTCRSRTSRSRRCRSSSWPRTAQEMTYLRERRAALGGSLPTRRRKSKSLPIPPLATFDAQLKATEGREISTTMAFVRVLNTLLRDKQIGKRVVPIVPDESRTFGMEGMFRQFGIFSQVGQLYQPEDARAASMYYREDKNGQILQEGINEPGAMSSSIAAATSYSTSDTPMIPFYVYYSMFGFQRVGDLAWAAGDMRARGFLIGGTAGRTTLNGEGLQHEDGHSHLLVDPELRLLRPDLLLRGRRDHPGRPARMYAEQEDVFYYITVMNENYEHPPCRRVPKPTLSRACTCSGKARRGAKSESATRVQLLGSGAILREVIAAADLLAEDWGIASDIWSVPSFTELRRDAIDAERWTLLHPTEPPRQSHVEKCLNGRGGPVVAATDCSCGLFADQIRTWVPGRYRVLGHRRLRTVGLPPQAAPLLRGGPALGDGGGAEVAGRGRRRSSPRWWRTRS